MKNYLSALILFFAAISIAPAQNKNLVTENSFAGITKSTTLQDLYKLFGKQNVSQDIDSGPEGGDTIAVTKIFKDKKNEIEIFWKENKTFKAIALVKSAAGQAPYITASQIKIGSPLSKLVEQNKSKISFSGFGWDYGGIISSYNKGKLAGTKIFYTLDIRNNTTDKLSGEGSFDTEMPLVKKYLTKIYINSISIAFD